MKKPVPLALSLVFLSLPSLENAIGQGKASAASVPANPHVNLPSDQSTPALAATYGNLPLSFEANQGQVGPEVRYLSRGQGYSLFLTDSAAVLD
jgi:hypothetical protein